MFRNFLVIVFTFTALQVSAYGTRYSSSNQPGGYVCGGVGIMQAGKATLAGAEILVSGNLVRGRLLGGVNASIFRGESKDDYNYTVTNAKYNYREYSIGLNVGVRLVRKDNFDLTVNCLFGEEILGFGYRDSTISTSQYHALMTDNFWYVRPAVSFNNRRNFGLTASYNMLFNDELLSPGKPAYGTASDFNGPVMSLIWITDHKHHSYYHHWHSHSWY